MDKQLKGGSPGMMKRILVVSIVFVVLTFLAFSLSHADNAKDY